MKNRILIAAWALLSLWGCASTPAGGPDEEGLTAEVTISNADLPSAKMIKGKVHVLVDETLATELEAMTGEDGYVRFEESRSISSLSPAMGIRSMRRVFPYAGDAWEKDMRVIGMHRWYTLTYDEDFGVAGTCSGLSGIRGIREIEFLPTMEIVGDTEVVYAEDMPDRSAASASSYFNDPRYPEQWYIYNNGTASSSISGCDLNVLPVWRNLGVTGDPDIIVAVIDGGVDYAHEDLSANMWVNPDRSDERLLHGQNFVSPGKPLIPEEHGTHVAGTIAAVSNNGIGVAGIAGGNAAKGQKGVRILNCQIFEGKNQADAAGTMYWSAIQGAVISQNSWSYTTSTTLPTTMKQDIDWFIDHAGTDPKTGAQTGPMKGGIVLFSAGNEDRDWGMPAQYERVVSVAAVAADFRKAYYSNYGKWIDVTTPGGDYTKGCQILAPVPDNKYAYLQGTSMACPCASGAAALILAKYKGAGFTSAELRSKLEAGGTDIDAFNKNYKGMLGKLVNTYKSIIGEGGIAPDVPTGLSASASSNTVTIHVTVPRDADEGGAAKINIYYSTSEFSSTSGLMFASFDTSDLMPGATLTGSFTGLDFNTKYWLGAVAYDLGGNDSPLSTLTTVTTGENHAPRLIAVGSTHADVKASGTGSITFLASDPDGHFFNIHLKDNGKPLNPEVKAVVVDTTDRSQLVVTISGPDSEEGSFSGTLTITDIYGLSASADYSYTVLPNHAPEISQALPDQVYTSKTKGGESFRLSGYFTDPDGDALTYSASAEFEDVNTLTWDIDQKKGILTITAKDFGYATMLVTARDGRGASVTQQIRVLVKDGSSALDIYPNPVIDNLFIRTASLTAVDSHIRIVGPTGALVQDKDVSLSAFDRAVFDMSACPSGLYSVAVTQNGKTTTKTVVKL